MPGDAKADLEIERLRNAIRAHRDQRGDDRCYLDDDVLYAVLPEGRGLADTRLHDPAVMLANCRRYIAHRHDPSVPYISPQRHIESVEALLREACAQLIALVGSECSCRQGTSMCLLCRSARALCATASTQ